MESVGYSSDDTEDGFQENLEQIRLKRTLRTQFRQELRRHIAENVKMGLYQLRPLIYKQCRFCRAINIAHFRQHQEMCQAVTYEFGCPCGFLCLSTKCLGGHSRTCEIAQSIKRQGASGWIPYITYDFRQRFLSETTY